MMGWKQARPVISVDLEAAQFQACVAAGWEIRLLDRWRASELQPADTLWDPPDRTPHAVTWQTRLGRFAVIVPQDAAESLTALDLTGGTADSAARIDGLVVEGLAIVLYVIMSQDLEPASINNAMFGPPKKIELLPL